MTACHTCELIQRRDEGAAPLWDQIFRTRWWDVVHSFDTSLLGWLCLICRRHVGAVADLTDDEARELGQLQRRVSIALHSLVHCQKTYIVQFAEARDHPHVHFHVIPRMPDFALEEIGPSIFKRLGVPIADRVSEAAMNELAGQLRQALAEIHAPAS